MANGTYNRPYNYGTNGANDTEIVNGNSNTSNQNGNDVYTIKQYEAIIDGSRYPGSLYVSIPENVVIVKRGLKDGKYSVLNASGLVFVGERIIEQMGLFGVNSGDLVKFVSTQEFGNDIDKFTKINTVDSNRQAITVDFTYKWRVVDPEKYIKYRNPEGAVLSYVQAFVNSFIKKHSYQQLTSGSLGTDNIRLNLKDDILPNGRPNIIKQIMDETVNMCGIRVTTLDFQEILPDKRIVEEMNKTEVVRQQVEQQKLKNDREIADIEAYKGQGFTNEQIARMRAITSGNARVIMTDGNAAGFGAQIGAGIEAARDSHTQNPSASDDEYGQEQTSRQRRR